MRVGISVAGGGLSEANEDARHVTSSVRKLLLSQFIEIHSFCGDSHEYRGWRGVQEVQLVRCQRPE